MTANRQHRFVVTDRGERVAPPAHHHRHYILRRLHQCLQELLQRAELDGIGKVVDLGCADQPYRPMMEARGWDYMGADLDGNARADLRIDEQGQLPCEANCFDLLLSTQVLEHVEVPGRYLSEAHRVLRPGGLMILSTHGLWRYHPDPVDYWRWTGAGLRRELEQQGFDVLEFRGLIGLAAAGLQLFQDGFKPRVHHRLRRGFFRLMQWLIAKVDRLESEESRRDDAMVFMCLARKRETPQDAA